MSGSFYICVQHPISVGTEGSQVSDSHISGKWGTILTKGCVYFLYSPISGSFDFNLQPPSEGSVILYHLG